MKGKLAKLKSDLKKLNVDMFDNVEHQLKIAEEELHEIDLLAKDGPLLGAVIDRRRELRSLVWNYSRRFEWLWHQKSRLKWAQEGDKNTRFFHVVASRRQSKNVLDSVVVDGVRVGDPEQVKQAVFRHLKDLYSEVWRGRPKLEGPFATIGRDGTLAELAAEFSEDEVRAAVKECDGDKALGPDGFNLACIQKNWLVMKNDVMQFMQEFHLNGKLVKGLNSSFIALVPKKENVVELRDFRPISLVNSIYKILAKVLSRRLKRVIPKIINEV